MVEYLFNAIRATAGEDIAIVARITDENGEPITSGCSFMLNGANGAHHIIDGVYTTNGVWEFSIPAELTLGLVGRYGYCFCNGDTTLCFEKPFYLM